MDDLFDRRDEGSAREDSIKRVEDNNDPSPMDRAMSDALSRLPSLPERISSDDILPDLSRYNFTDPRAMGPLMRRLTKLGAVEPTGVFRPSKRARNHKGPRRVYLNNHHTK